MSPPRPACRSWTTRGWWTSTQCPTIPALHWDGYAKSMPTGRKMPSGPPSGLDVMGGVTDMCDLECTAQLAPGVAPVRLVVLPLAVILCAACEHSQAGPLPLVVPPGALVGVAVAAGLGAATVAQIADCLALHGRAGTLGVVFRSSRDGRTATSPPRRCARGTGAVMRQRGEHLVDVAIGVLERLDLDLGVGVRAKRIDVAWIPPDIA